jgi:uncharacterized integral membrane protein
MPWRLIQFIVVFAIFLLFIIFNVENRCDINLGFVVFKDVLVFITAFFAFIAGMLCTFPFILGSKLRKRQKNLPKKEEKKSKNPTKPNEDASLGNGSYGID